MCVYFYTFHQAKFSNLLGFTSRSLELCHQGISFILLSVFGLNIVILSTVILSRPSKHKIYLLIDHQYQWNLSIHFSSVLEMLGDEQMPSQPQNTLWCTNKHFDPFTKKLHFKKGVGGWLGGNVGMTDNFFHTLKQPLEEMLIIKIAKENINQNVSLLFFSRLTSLPVSTCLASFTLAKFPFPIVFSKR